MSNRLLLLIVLASHTAPGCQTPWNLSQTGSTSRDSCPLLAAPDKMPASDSRSSADAERMVPANESPVTVAAESPADDVIVQASWQPTPASEAEAPELPLPDSSDREPASRPIELQDVISSVLSTYPMVQAAALQFDLAQGRVTSAEGAFDVKLKGASENGPLGFYETYRHSLGAVQPLPTGGEVFGGYRIGRGRFQPWYQERQTNDGGEFKGGLSVPLSRNQAIDARRAGVFKASLDLAAADPQFRSEVILVVQAASESYWTWVAANAHQRIAEQVLTLATTRNEGLKEEVRMGAKAPPVLKDNRRSILSREAKLIDARRKVAQTAARLSVFLRTPTGEPMLPSEDQVPGFAEPQRPDDQLKDRLLQQAIQYRPDLRELDLSIERIDVEILESQNDLLPNIDAIVVGSQDMGQATSKKRDKSEFELEAALVIDVPLQRRKARGKLSSLEAKRAQLALKRRLSEDKIQTELAVAVAGLKAAYERVQRTTEAQELAEFMAEVEREKFAAGESNLLSVALREEKAAEAAGTAINALLEYQIGLTSLRAAVGVDDGEVVEWSP